MEYKDVVVGTTDKALSLMREGMVGNKWSWIGLNNPPKGTLGGNKVFMSVDGQVLGYFIITDANMRSRKLTYVFNKDTWTPLDNPIHSNLQSSNHKYIWW